MTRLVPLIVCAAASITVACSQQNTLPDQPTPAASTAASTAGTTAKSTGRLVDTPATSTLNAGAISSDGVNGGVYTDTGGVTSIIQTSNTCCNDWILDTEGTTRFMNVDFGHPLDGGIPPVGLKPGRIIIECHLADGSAAFPGIQVGAPVACPMVLSFPGSTKNTIWKVGFGGSFMPTYSGTDLALVSCTSAIGGQCHAWSVASTGTGTGKLILVSNTGKLLQNQGRFTMPFSFSVTD